MKRSGKKAADEYGSCPICTAPKEIPGLDGFKCVSCGWIKESEVQLLVKKRQAKKIKEKI
jgi:rubredoxin